jgi:integrase
MKGGGFFVQVSYYVDGKQKRKSRRVSGTKRDAETAKLDMLRQIDNPGEVTLTAVTSSMTFGAFLESKWIPFVHNKVGTNDSPSTATGTESRLSHHVLPYRIAQVRCWDLDCLKMDDWMGQLRRARPDLSERTLQNVYANVRTACRQAVAWKLMPQDPTAGMGNQPHPRTHHGHQLTKTEANKLMAAFQDHELGVAFLMVLAVGIRPGQVCALRWANFDFEGYTVTPEKGMVPQSARLGGGLKECQAKTEASASTRYISPVLMPLVQAHRLRRMDACLAYGRPEALIISKRNGGVMRPNYLSYKFKQLTVALGLPQSMVLYDLRHAFARFTLKGGTDLHTTSRAIGHSRMSTTSQFYLDDDTDLRVAAADVIAKAILPTREARA